MQVKVDGITKKFGKVRAVDRLSFTVEDNSILGLIGPNAAGKTTTLKIISGLLAPTSGRVLYDDGLERPPTFYYWPGSSFGWVANLGRWLETYAMYFGFTRREAKERVKWLAEKFSFTEHLNKYDWTASFGTRMKVLVSLSFIPKAELYCLDEPFPGLDPYTRRTVSDTIRELRDKGKTMIISSHVLGEIEGICDKVVVINRAKLVTSGPPMVLKKAMHQRRFEVVFDGQPPQQLRDVAENLGLNLSVKQDVTTIFGIVKEDFSAEAILSILPRDRVLSTTLRLPSLEEIVEGIAAESL